MKRIPLHWQIIIGLVFGVIFALVSSWLGWSEFTINWIDPWGRIFINLLKLIAVPLVLFSIIKGISGLSDIRKIGRIGTKTLGLYVITTFAAVTIGLVLVNLIKPGTLMDEEARKTNRIEYEKWVASTDGVEFKDSLRLLGDYEGPMKKGDDIVTIGGIKGKVAEYTDTTILADLGNGMQVLLERSAIREEGNSKVKEKIAVAKKTKNAGPLQFVVDMVPSNIFTSLNDNGLMLQVIFFAIFFGIVMTLIPKDKAKPVIDFVDGANEVFLKMVDVVMKAAPFFVFALLAGVMSKLAGDDPNKVVEIFKSLSWYSLVVVAGLAFMIFVFYPLIVVLFIKKISYRDFFKAISPAQLLAFSTSSSAATLPVTMECVHENLKVDEEITSFVLPIGATVNMDGTSLYQAVAVIFLAQFHMVDLDLTSQLIIILTATLASIGSAAVPSAGLIMLILVLESVGLNPAWIAIIFPVDRILDMCRTVVNVTGDATVSSLVASTEGGLNYGKQEEGAAG